MYFEAEIIGFVSTVRVQVYIQFLYLDGEVTSNVKETKTVWVCTEQLSFYRLPICVVTRQTGIFGTAIIQTCMSNE